MRIPISSPVFVCLGLWYHVYPSMFGGFLAFVSDMMAMSFLNIVRAISRLVVLPVIPFAFEYSSLILFLLFLFFLIFFLCVVSVFSFLLVVWPS